MSAPMHLHSLDDLDAGRVRELLDRAERYRDKRVQSLLRGRCVVLLFLSPSLRTRVSMELAAQQLGAYIVTLTGDASLWKFEYAEGAVMRGDAAEHVKEAVRVLARYGDLLAVRSFPGRRSWQEDSHDPVLRAFLKWSDVPVLNLESCLYHPCQAAADILTIRRAAGEKPGKVVLTWADHPKALPVAVPDSFALAVTQMGWDLTIARPEGYDLPQEVIDRCIEHADDAGSVFEVTADREAALKGARFVYAKSWGRLDCYGNEEHELRERRTHNLERWRVDATAMKLTADAYFMHCLPVRRNVVVTDDVLDGPRSLILDQAENRLHVQKAILLELLQKRGTDDVGGGRRGEG